jgi:hypothetical protein
MKAFSILIIAPILLALFVSSVDAQSPATVTKSPVTVTKKRTPSVNTKRRIPPAPPIPMRGSKYRPSAKNPPMLGEPDPTGRKDLAGRAVPFYPTSKGVRAVQNGVSPLRQGRRVATK